MIAQFKNIFISLSLVFFFLSACNTKFDDNDFSAFFGGEIINPVNNFVVFMKDDFVIDTIFLDATNRFMIKFDSLTPGLYTFRHEPEYQYVYFEKNDSIMVRINSKDFDESIVFCGRGDEKNNFLMELYLKNESDRKAMFDFYDYDYTQFIQNIDSAFKIKEKFYAKKKQDIQWSAEFDLYAKASLDLPYYTVKEFYPIAHKVRMGKDITPALPQNYYTHRKTIDFNNPELANYSPFVKFLTHMMGNISQKAANPLSTQTNHSLEIGIQKLNIADTLFKNDIIKNKILHNIAFSYLLEDQNAINNKVFLEHYNKIATNDSNVQEINTIGQSIQNLSQGNILPNVTLIDLNGNRVSSNSLLKKPTVFFFWTENAEYHFKSAHKKALEYHKRFPKYQFIAINIDEDSQNWKTHLNKHQFGTINEFRAADFQELKDKWVITKLHRTLIIDNNGSIKNAFVNLFDARFGDYLAE